MNHSEKLGEFAAAWLRARNKMADIVKDAKNPHYGSGYASLEIVVDIVYGAFASEQIAIIQGGTTKVSTLMIHAPSGEWVECEPMEFALNSDPQKMAAASTYGRRYGLLGAACAKAEDDDGNRAAGKYDKKPAAQKPQGPTPLERAVKLRLIPTADRVIFNDYCKERVPGYDKAPDATARMQLVESHLTRLEAQNAK